MLICKCTGTTILLISSTYYWCSWHIRFGMLWGFCFFKNIFLKTRIHGYPSLKKETIAGYACQLVPKIRIATTSAALAVLVAAKPASPVWVACKSDTYYIGRAVEWHIWDLVMSIENYLPLLYRCILNIITLFQSFPFLFLLNKPPHRFPLITFSCTVLIMLNPDMH